MTFNLRQSPEEAAVVGSLAAGEMIGVWFRQTILDGTRSRTDIEGGLCTAWSDTALPSSPHPPCRCFFPARKQACVRPGWRIIAKDILTDEVHDLGFIDAESENRSLEGILLPDGDYEVSVLTSSLFWKDASDFEVRLLSIRHGEEVSSFPTVYNLRSSVSQGERTIHWSATPSDTIDCVFGVWYSAASPVPTDGPPAETVWYFAEMTEYQETVAPKFSVFSTNALF